MAVLESRLIELALSFRLQLATPRRKQRCVPHAKLVLSLKLVSLHPANLSHPEKLWPVSPPVMDKRRRARVTEHDMNAIYLCACPAKLSLKTTSLGLSAGTYLLVRK